MSRADHAALFATAADDALEVIELVHTQIHTELLLGTIVERHHVGRPPAGA